MKRLSICCRPWHSPWVLTTWNSEHRLSCNAGVWLVTALGPKPQVWTCRHAKAL